MSHVPDIPRDQHTATRLGVTLQVPEDDSVIGRLRQDVALLELVVFRLKNQQERTAGLMAARVDPRQLATAITQAEGGLLWLTAALTDG